MQLKMILAGAVIGTAVAVNTAEAYDPILSKKTNEAIDNFRGLGENPMHDQINCEIKATVSEAVATGKKSDEIEENAVVMTAIRGACSKKGGFSEQLERFRP